MDSVLPPDFRFHPSEEELVFHFLRRKNNGIKEKLDVIPEADIYKCEPWDLPDRSILPKCNKQWYFFSPYDRKYPGGLLANRITEAGYWRATRTDLTGHSQSTSTGVRKTLIFHKGRPPYGEKTEWSLREYHLDENKFKTGAGLQNAFVLCHVLKKNELPAKSGGFQNAEIEKCDSSPKNRNPSCDEDKSEDRSKQLEEVQAYSSLPQMTEDTVARNSFLDRWLDGTSSGSLSVGPGEDTVSQQVDSMPNGSGSHSEFAGLLSNNNHFRQVPADIYLSDEEMDEYFNQTKLLEDLLHACQDSQNSNVDHYFPQDSYAHVLNGDFIELDDLDNGNDSSLSFESAFNNEGARIQLRPRSPALHSYQHDMSSEGTSKRRIRMQLHKMEASAGPNEKCVKTADIHYASSSSGENQISSMCDPQSQQLLSDSCVEHRRNLEIATQSENSAIGREVTNPKDESTCYQNHEVIYPANVSSVSNSADIPVSQSLTSTFLQQSAVLNVEPSGTIVMSLNEFDMSDKLSAVDLLHNSVNSVSESPKVLLSQAACLGENSTFGGSLANSGTLSLVQLGKKSSAINSSDGKLPTLPNKGSKPSNMLLKFLSSIPGRPASAMELPANFKSDKHILGLEDASNSGSLSYPSITNHVTTPMLKKVSKGIVEYPRLDSVSSGLRARSVQESKNIVAGGRDKRREASEHSAGTSPSLVQPRCLSGLFSRLSKRVSLTGSHGAVVLACLFGTAILFLFFLLSSILCIFDSTFSAVAF